MLTQQGQGKRLPVGILLLGLALNLALLLFYYLPEPKQLISDEDYYYKFAVAAASTTPLPEHPLRPPLYGRLIGVLFAAFGTGVLSVQLLQIACWFATGLMLWDLARRIGTPPVAANAALLLYFISPELAAFSHYLWPETLHLFVWMLALWLLVRHPSSTWAAAAGGAALAAALAIKSLLLPFVPILAVFLVLRQDSGLTAAARLRYAAVMTGALLIAFWAVHGTASGATARPLVPSTLVFNAWVGLNDRTTSDSSDNEIVGQEMRDYLAGSSVQAARDARYMQAIREKLAGQGLRRTLQAQLGRQYFRLLDIRTFFTTQLPGGGRASHPPRPEWLVALLRHYAYATYGFVLVVGAAGLCFVRWRPIGWPQLLGLFVLYNLTIFLVLHAITRYVLQFLPVLVLMAGSMLHVATQRGKNQSEAVPWMTFSPARMVFAAVLAAVICYLMLRNLLGSA